MACMKYGESRLGAWFYNLNYFQFKFFDATSRRSTETGQAALIPCRWGAVSESRSRTAASPADLPSAQAATTAAAGGATMESTPGGATEQRRGT
jgi:hypothetical protein